MRQIKAICQIHLYFSSTFFDEFELIEQPFQNFRRPFYGHVMEEDYLLSSSDDCFDNKEKDYGILNGQLFLMSMIGGTMLIYDERWLEKFPTGAPLQDSESFCRDSLDVRKYVTVKGFDDNG